MFEKGRKRMYFITAMTNILTEETKFNSDKAKQNSERCFGYYKEKEKAVNAVETNLYDMWETIYNYIVIENVEEGVHPFAKVVGWYKYNKELNKYEPIKIERTGFSNYSMG
jgi:hypothetical protein